MRRIRQQHRMTQKQLASRMNVSPSAISGWETGARQPSYDDLKRLAQFFGVTADYFLYPNRNSAADQVNDDFYMSVLYSPFPDPKEKHIMRRTLFFLAVSSTYATSFSGSPIVLAVTFLLWFSYLAIRVVQLFTRGDSTRMIYYKNKDQLYFAIDWSDKKIRYVRFNNLYLLVLNMVFGFMSIMFTQVFYQVNREDSHQEFFYTSFVLFLALYTYLFTMEFTSGRIRRTIPFFKAGKQFYITRFYVAAVMNGVFFFLTSVDISINRPYDQPMPLFVITVTLSLFNFLLSVVLLCTNKLNYAEYRLYHENLDGSRRTRIA
ncbi:MAG: helix-turn-helix domain-containing protein [Acholeplasmataceae bacterium]